MTVNIFCCLNLKRVAQCAQCPELEGVWLPADLCPGVEVRAGYHISRVTGRGGDVLIACK